MDKELAEVEVLDTIFSAAAICMPDPSTSGGLNLQRRDDSGRWLPGQSGHTAWVGCHGQNCHEYNPYPPRASRVKERTWPKWPHARVRSGRSTRRFASDTFRVHWQHASLVEWDLFLLRAWDAWIILDNLGSTWILGWENWQDTPDFTCWKASGEGLQIWKRHPGYSGTPGHPGKHADSLGLSSVGTKTETWDR